MSQRWCFRKSKVAHHSMTENVLVKTRGSLRDLEPRARRCHLEGCLRKRFSIQAHALAKFYSLSFFRWAKEWGRGESPLENGKVPLGGGAQGWRRRLSRANIRVRGPNNTTRKAAELYIVCNESLRKCLVAMVCSRFVMMTDVSIWLTLLLFIPFRPRAPIP